MIIFSSHHVCMALRKKIIVFFALVLVCVVPLSVYADNYGIENTVRSTGGLLPTSIGGANTVPEFIGVIIRTVLSLLAIVFFLLIFYAGILWMTARGNQSIVDKSKSMMEGAIIGLIIVMASYAISRFVFSNLTGEGRVEGVSKTGSQCSVNISDEMKEGTCTPTAASCTGQPVKALDETCGYCCVK